MAEKKINLPNWLTIARVCAIPLIMPFILIPSENRIWMDIVAASLFLLAALTDLFDGMIARRSSMVTNFGKFLDPIADKMLIASTLIAFIGSERFAYIRILLVICTVIILLREFAVTSIRLIVAKRDGKVISANFWGKLKTAFSVVAIITVLLEPVIFSAEAVRGLRDSHVIAIAVIIIMTLLTAWSGYRYIRKYFSYIDPTK